ncbi:MAG: rod shape-determining protein RodA [Cyclobacteriaceae bacterium]|nr:rod shape-determining protein RodA [Cyclobacteriaceae bacterium]
MRRTDGILDRIDWLTVALYGLLVLAGLLNIYAAIYDIDNPAPFFSFGHNAGKQMVFIAIALIIAISILAVDYKVYDTISYPLWALFILLLVVVLFVAREVNGARSWIELGSFRFQPSEFTKFATALAIAKYISRPSFKITRLKDAAILILLIGIPALLIIVQGDMGTALVFSVFILVLYREGMSPIPLILGISAAVIFLLALLVQNHLYFWLPVAGIAGLVLFFNRKSVRRMVLILIAGILVIGMFESVGYAFDNFLKPHQQNRILVLLNPNADPLGAGWNVTQSKIAIGSGGLSGKGYLNGTQTKFDFVPEQSTDFIFCTIGEEQGWIGSMILIVLFTALLLRVTQLAERQKWRFARVYGYSVATILFFHFTVNIGMTIGLFPVIGIPLPFFSYGGSSLISFTILLFILIALDANRMQRLAH